jgi:hypothetical protein
LGIAAASLQPLTLANAGVQNAPSGAIQDPAGSAVGATGRDGAQLDPVNTGSGGASGALYQKFPSLKWIPPIQPRSAIFNTDPGAGCRVVHTLSPDFRGGGDPASSADRARVLQDIANAYANAILAFNLRALGGGDGKTLNLVPVSGSIFAGAFAHDFGSGGAANSRPLVHLHPSYTITAIAMAANALAQRSEVTPLLVLYYFEPRIFQAAQGVLADLRPKP